MPLSKAGLPAEFGDVQQSSYLSAGSFDLMLTALLDSADRFPELRSEIQHTVSQWNYCPLVNIHGASDVRVLSESVSALKVTYSTAGGWSGFSRVANSMRDGWQSKHSRKSIYYSDSLQCLTDFDARSTLKADHRLRGGPTRLRAGSNEVAGSWYFSLQECGAESRSHDVLSVTGRNPVGGSARVVTFISGKATRSVTAHWERLAAGRSDARLQQVAVDVHDSRASDLPRVDITAVELQSVDSRDVDGLVTGSQAIAIGPPLVPPHVEPAADSPVVVGDRFVAGAQTAVQAAPVVPVDAVEPGYRSEHSPFIESEVAPRMIAGAVAAVSATPEPEVSFVETFFTETRVREKPALQQSIGETAFADSSPAVARIIEIPAVQETQSERQPDQFMATINDDTVYRSSVFNGVRSYSGLALSRLSGTLQLNRQLIDGSQTAGAEVTLKPFDDDYWFARVGASVNTESGVTGYRWGIGYDDWHPGSWFIQLNNWGPVNAGSGLDLENAVLSTGYKFKSAVLERLNITSSASLYASAEGATDDRVRRFAENAGANLTLQWTPLNNWFVRASLDQKLEGGPLRWSYVFGRYNWRANQLNIEYANYSQSRAFEPNFEEGTIGISYNLKF